ncbi:MAG: hypothetical protein AAGF85_04875 [Bacteroidota bacterium]
MNLEEKVNQLTELLSELTPAVDALVTSQRGTDENVNKLVQVQTRTNLAVGELRQSNMRLAGAIEKLIDKIDKVDDFENRLKRIEDKLAM